MNKEVSKQLFQSIRQLITATQQQVVRNINAAMLLTYFEIGKMIVENEKQGKDRAVYAAQTLKTLSISLTEEFGRGYSKSNLEYMVKFYLVYKERSFSIAQSLIGRSKKKVKNTITESL